MKKFSALALVVLVAAAFIGCSRGKDDNSNVAAVPNANCQYPNQYSCWPQGMANGYQPYQVPGGYGYQSGTYGCQGYTGGYQPAYYPGYGMGCIPQQYLGYNPYYYQANTNPYYNSYYQMGNYGYNQYAVACDLYYQSCVNGLSCRPVGMGRLGICSQ